MTWADMTRDQRLEAVRQGYLKDRSNTQIAAALGASKNAVSGLAWRWRLSPANASIWKLTTRRKGSIDNRVERVRVRKPPKPIAERRLRLENHARDANSRRIVDAINALPLFDHDIAEVLGVSPQTIRNWRNGKHRVTPFWQQCVNTAVARLETGRAGL